MRRGNTQAVGKMPPDQQMHAELQRIPELDYLAHAKVTAIISALIACQRWLHQRMADQPIPPSVPVQDSADDSAELAVAGLGAGRF